MTTIQATRGELKRHRGVWSNADWLIVGALCGVVVLLPALVSLAAGSFSISHNDDWSYRRVAEGFAQTGHLAFNGWEAMTLVGQVLWAWPFLRIFGDQGWVFAASALPLAVIGVASAYYVARQLLGPLSASAAVLLVGVFPGFAWSVPTFMTDVPAFAAEMACLALGVLSLKHKGRKRWAYLAAALVVGAFGFSVREFALAAPLAVVLCAGLSDDRGRRRTYLLVGVAELLACLLIYEWSKHIPGGLQETLVHPGGLTTAHMIQAYFTMAFVLSPAIIVVAWRRLRWRLSWASGVMGVVLLAGLVVHHHYHELFVGNYLSSTGALVGVPFLSPFVWRLATVVALVSGTLLAGIALGLDRRALREWRRWPWGSPLAVLVSFGTVLGIGLVAFGLTDNGFYDRYLWPLTFVVAVLLLTGCERRSADRGGAPSVYGLAAAIAALVLFLSVTLTIGADNYYAALWRAGQIAMQRGVPPSEVDAGFDWVGSHVATVLDRSLHPAAPAYEPKYARELPGFRECAIVSISPLNYPNLHLVKSTSYEVLGFIGSRTLYIYISAAPGC